MQARNIMFRLFFLTSLEHEKDHFCMFFLTQIVEEFKVPIWQKKKKKGFPTQHQDIQQ